MKLIRTKKTAEINSPQIHQRVLNSIHQISKEEIFRTANAMSIISEHLKTKKQEKQEKQSTDITPVYLVF